MKKVGYKRGGLVLHTLLVVLIIALLLAPLVAATSHDKDKKEQDPAKITPEDFAKLSPAKQDQMFPNIPPAKQVQILQQTYRDALAEKFFKNKAQVTNPANAQIALKYFNNPTNVAKDLGTAQEYFKQPGKIAEAGAGATKYFATKYQANYQFEASANNLNYDPEKGTLSLGNSDPPKNINLADYKGDSSIQEIKAEGDEFIIKRRVGDKDESMRLTGDSGADISFKDGKFTLKDKAGNTHDIQSQGDAVLDISVNGVTIEGEAVGTAVIDGKAVDFVNRNGKLFMAPNGDISADDAWVDTAALQLDGKFSKQGNDVHTHAYNGRETTLVDKQSGVGVITRGVSAITHLDTASPHSRLIPPKINENQAKDIAAGLRAAPAGPAPDQAEVWIKNDGVSTAVYARGKVDVQHHIIDESDVLGVDTLKPQYSGKDPDASFDYTTDNAPDDPAEKFIMSGIGEYTDMQMTIDGEQKGASVSKLNPSATHDMLDVSCEGCRDGAGIRVRKNLVLFNNQEALTDEQALQAREAGLAVDPVLEQSAATRTPQRATFEISYNVKDGKLAADTSTAQLQTIATLLGSGMEVAADKQLLTKVEGQNDFFGLGQQGIGRYESTGGGKTGVVGIVLQNPDGVDSPLGQKIRFDMGVDPTKLNNPTYLGEMDKALSARVKADKHVAALQKRFAALTGKGYKGAEMGEDGFCLNKQCNKAMKAMPQFRRIQLRLQAEHLKSENAKNRALVASLRADGKSTDIVEKQIKANKKKYRGLKKEQKTMYEKDQARLPVSKRDAKHKKAAEEAQAFASKFAKQNRHLNKNIANAEEDMKKLTEKLHTEDRADRRQGILDRIAAIQRGVNTIKQERGKLEAEYQQTTQDHQGDNLVLGEMALNIGDLGTAMAHAKELKGDAGHLLVAKACAQVGDAQCVSERSAKIKNPRMAEKAKAAQDQIEEQMMANLNQQVRDLRQRESKARTDFKEERRTNILSHVSFLAAWYETDKELEKRGERYVEGVSQAAYATKMLRAKLKEQGGDTSFEAIRRMPDAQKREILGADVPLGDFAQFDKTMFKQATAISQGKTLSAQEHFEARKAAADQKVMFAHGDVVAAEKEYRDLHADYGHLKGTIRGVGELDQTLVQIHEDKEINIAGINTGIHTPWSYQTVGRMTSEALDITMVADIAAGGAIVAKGLITAAKTSATAAKVTRGLRVAGTALKESAPAVKVVTKAGALKTGAGKVLGEVAEKGRRLAEPVVKLAQSKPVQAVVEAGKKLTDLERSGIAQFVAPKAKKLGEFGKKAGKAVKEVATKPQYLKPTEARKAALSAEKQLIAARKFTKTLDSADDAVTIERLARLEDGVKQLHREANILDEAAKVAKKTFKPNRVFGREKARKFGERLDDFKNNYEIAAKTGTHAEKLAAAKKLNKLNAHKEKIRDLEVIADNYFRKVVKKHVKKTGAVGEQAAKKVTKATAKTVAPTTAQAAAREADELTDVAVFGGPAANIDYESMPALCKATGTCDPTPFGEQVALRAGMTPDEFASRATSLRRADDAAGLSDAASGNRILTEARSAELGRGPGAAVTPTGNIESITGKARVNPTAKLDAGKRAQLEARLDKSHGSLEGVHAEETGNVLPFPTEQARKRTQAMRRQEAALERARKNNVFAPDVEDLTDQARLLPPDIPDLTGQARLLPPDIPDLTANARLLPPDIPDFTDQARQLPPDIEDMTDAARLVEPPPIPGSRGMTPDELQQAMARSRPEDLTDEARLLPPDIPDMTDQARQLPPDIPDLTDAARLDPPAPPPQAFGAPQPIHTVDDADIVDTLHLVDDADLEEIEDLTRLARPEPPVSSPERFGVAPLPENTNVEAVASRNVDIMQSATFSRERDTMWVDYETGEVLAIGRYEDVKKMHLDGTPFTVGDVGVQVPVKRNPSGHIEITTNLEGHISNKANEALGESIRKHNSLSQPELVAFPRKPPAALDEIKIPSHVRQADIKQIKRAPGVVDEFAKTRVDIRADEIRIPSHFGVPPSQRGGAGVDVFAETRVGPNPLVDEVISVPSKPRTAFGEMQDIPVPESYRVGEVDEFGGKVLLRRPGLSTIPGLEDIVAKGSDVGYASRTAILDDVRPFTSFLEDADVKWAVSGSGGIADELAVVGKRTGDADLLIPSSKWESLDEMLEARAKAGTLGQIGVKEYRPMKYDPFDAPNGVGFDSAAKGSVVLENGQEIDLISGFGYKVTDPKAIREGVVEVAPGVKLPVKKTQDGRHRVELFDLDESGNPTVSSFFQQGEEGVTFMTPDALRAKYTFEKRLDRLELLNDIEEKRLTEVFGLPKTKITKRPTSPSRALDELHPVDPQLHYTHPEVAKHAEADPDLAEMLATSNCKVGGFFGGAVASAIGCNTRVVSMTDIRTIDDYENLVARTRRHNADLEDFKSRMRFEVPPKPKDLPDRVFGVGDPVDEQWGQMAELIKPGDGNLLLDQKSVLVTKQDGSSIRLKQTFSSEEKGASLRLALKEPGSDETVAHLDYILDPDGNLYVLGMDVNPELQRAGIGQQLLQDMTDMHPNVDFLETQLAHDNLRSYAGFLRENPGATPLDAALQTPAAKQRARAGWEIDVEASDLPGLKGASSGRENVNLVYRRAEVSDVPKSSLALAPEPMAIRPRPIPPPIPAAARGPPPPPKAAFDDGDTLADVLSIAPEPTLIIPRPQAPSTLPNTDFLIPDNFNRYPPQNVPAGTKKGVVTGPLAGGDSGGTARVFVGRVEGVDTDVAIKISKDFVAAHGDEAIDLMKQEVRTAQELEALGLPMPKQYGIVETGGNIGKAEEIIEGGIAFKGGKPIRGEDYLDGLERVTEETHSKIKAGLRRAEEAGHQPSDIQYMVMPDGDVKFFDFGNWEKGRKFDDGADLSPQSRQAVDELEKFIETAKEYKMTTARADDVASPVFSTATNPQTGRKYIPEGLGQEIFTPDNIDAALVKESKMTLLTVHVDAKSGKIRILQEGDQQSVMHLDGDFLVGMNVNEEGKIVAGLGKMIRNGKMDPNEAVPQWLLDKYLNPHTIVYNKAIKADIAAAKNLDDVFETAAKHIDHPLVVSSEVSVVSKEIDGIRQFEIDGILRDVNGRTLGGFEDGRAFKHTIRVDEDGISTVQRRFNFGDNADESLIARTIEAEQEQLHKALQRLSINEYRTVPNSPAELSALCGSSICRVAEDMSNVANDVEGWLGSPAGRQFLDTPGGQQWYRTVQEEKGFFGRFVDKVKGRKPVDADKLPSGTNMYPDTFMKDRKYVVNVDVFSEVAEKAPTTILESRAIVPHPTVDPHLYTTNPILARRAEADPDLAELVAGSGCKIGGFLGGAISGAAGCNTRVVSVDNVVDMRAYRAKVAKVEEKNGILQKAGSPVRLEMPPPPQNLPEILPKIIDAPDTPIPRLRQPDVPRRLAHIDDRNDISDEVRAALDDVDFVDDVVDVSPSIGKIGNGDSAVEQLKLNRPKVVHKKDGRKVKWEVDTSNPDTARVRAKGQLGAEDSGRKQMAAAALMDESDDVLVVGVRRRTFPDGSGYIEKDIIEGAQDLGVTPLEMRNSLKNLQQAEDISAQEAEQLAAMLRKQGVKNNLLGFSAQGHQFKRMPDGSLKLVMEPNPNTMKGMLDYEVLHEISDTHLSDTGDSVYGFFNKADYYDNGLFNAQKFNEHVASAVDDIENMIADKGGFIKKYTDAGYTPDEAEKMFKRIELRVQNARRELETGRVGDVRNMIDNGGRLLAQSDGTYTALRARKAAGPRVKVFPKPLQRGNMRLDVDTVADFVPKHTPKSLVRRDGFRIRIAEHPPADPKTHAHNTELFGAVAKDPNVKRSLRKVDVPLTKRCSLVGFAAHVPGQGGCEYVAEVATAPELASVQKLNEDLGRLGVPPARIVETQPITQALPEELLEFAERQLVLARELGHDELHVVHLTKIKPGEIGKADLKKVARVFAKDLDSMARTNQVSPDLQKLVNNGVIDQAAAKRLALGATAVKEGIPLGAVHGKVVDEWASDLASAIASSSVILSVNKVKILRTIQRQADAATKNYVKEQKFEKLKQEAEQEQEAQLGGRKKRKFTGKSQLTGIAS